MAALRVAVAVGTSVSPAELPGGRPDEADAKRRAGAAGERPAASSRLLGVATSLLRIHFDIAEAEATAEKGRLLRGLVCLLLAGFFLLLGLLFGQALGLFLLRAAGLSWPGAICAAGGADLTIGLVFALAGRRALRSPALPQTRALLRRTLSALLSP